MSRRQMILAVLLLMPGHAQNLCDPALAAQADKGPSGYRMRGTRCEGSFGRLVSSGALSVVSFTESFPNFDAASGVPLTLEWTALDSKPVNVRALPLKRKLYYQMDAVANGAKFTWPIEILRALEIKRQDIGVTVWVRAEAGGTQRDVHVPVRIRQQAAAASQAAYEVSIYPAMELAEVYITLSGGGIILRPARALDYGYYPAERRIDFSVDKPADKGIYFLEIGATLKTGGSVTAPLYFYHPGSTP